MEDCLGLAIRTGRAAGSVALTQNWSGVRFCEVCKAVALSVVLLPLSCLGCPNVLTQGLVRVLVLEGCLVTRHLSGVFQTGGSCAAYSRELAAELSLNRTKRRGTGDGLDAAEVHAVALTYYRGSCYAVGTKGHLLVSGVCRLFVDFVQCTGNVLEHRCGRENCHVAFGCLNLQPI